MTTALVLSLLCAAPVPDPAAPPDPQGFVGYLEWMLDVPVTQAQLDELRGLITLGWTKRDPFEVRLVRRGIELEKDLANHSQADRDALRSSVEDEYFKTLKHRGQGLPLTTWILALRTSARRRIAPGEPPLTRQTADGLAELSAFVAGNAFDASAKAFRDTFARGIAAGWPRLSAEQRGAIAAAPRTWARVRWLPAADRARWRADLVEGADGGFEAADPKELAALALRLAERAAAFK